MFLFYSENDSVSKYFLKNGDETKQNNFFLCLIKRDRNMFAYSEIENETVCKNFLKNGWVENLKSRIPRRGSKMAY